MDSIEKEKSMALVRNNEFHGIIGTETGTIVDGVPVCIGDVVRVAPGSNHHQCEGIVGIFFNKLSVMGIASEPLSNLDVVEIIASHEKAVTGSKIHNSPFKAEEFKN